MDVIIEKKTRLNKMLAFLCFSMASASIDAFQVPRSSLHSMVPTTTCLDASLSTPPLGDSTALDKGPDAKDTKVDKQLLSVQQQNDDIAIFHKYLKSMSKHIDSKRTLANRMDDELKRLEIGFYDLSGENSPVCRFDTSRFSYKGPLVRPDARCYAMVCSAYSNAGLGEVGATLAEETMQRYEHHTGELANSHVLTGVMKAWARADHWKKADYWIRKMEERFAESKDPLHAPDCFTYTAYIEGLSLSLTVNKEKAATQSLEILSKMRELYISGDNPSTQPTRYTYAHVMRCQERSCSGFRSIERVEKVFRQLQEDYRTFDMEELKPNAIAALPLVSAAAQCRGSMKAVQMAEGFLEELQVLYEETHDPDYKPLEAMYTLILTAYAKVDTRSAPQCAERVDDILKAMKKNWMRPSAHAITAAINAKSNHRSEKSLNEAEELMRTMKYPDSLAYQCLIKAYCRVGNPKKADALFVELEDLSNKSYGNKVELLAADVMTTGTVIAAWGRAEKKDKEVALTRAEKHLADIVHKYEEGLVGPFEKHVDSWVFEAVIRLWSGSRKPESGLRIEAIIKQMEALNEDIPDLFYPTANTYLLALDAWAISGRADSGKHAMGLIRKLQKLHEEGKAEEPNIRFLSSAFASVTRSSGRGVVKTAEALYQQILERFKQGDRSASVNARTLTSLLSTILKTGEHDAAERALKILRQTIELGKDDLSHLAPNTIAFNCVLNGLARRRASDEAWDIFQEMKQLQSEGYDSAPDVVSYSCVARAIPRAQSEIAVERLEEMTAEIVDRYERGDLKADIQLFNTIITGYSNLSKFDPTAATKANDLLKRLEDSSVSSNPIKPDLISFRSLCRAFAMSQTTDSAKLAQATLQRAQSLADEGHCPPPDTELYSSVVLAHTRSKDEGSLEIAERIIDQMEALYKEGDTEARPNTLAFNLLLAGYASSQDRNKVAEAVRVFDKMRCLFEEGQTDCEPDVHSFNWIIRAAAISNPDSSIRTRDNFEIALQNFKLLHTDAVPATPNSQTYEFFLQACANLLPEGETRSKLVRKAFELGCKHGLVTQQLCKDAYQWEPTWILSKMGNAGETDRDGAVVIPENWCNQVPYRRRVRSVKLIEKNVRWSGR